MYSVCLERVDTKLANFLSPKEERSEKDKRDNKI